MTKNERTKIVSEMLDNTLEFLSSELTLQLKHENTSYSENLKILNDLIVCVFVNHIVNCSKFSKMSPIEVLKSFNIEDKINDIVSLKGNHKCDPACSGYKKTHEE